MQDLPVCFQVRTQPTRHPLFPARQILWASSRLYAHAIPGEMNRATWVFGCLALCLMSEKELVEFIFHTCKLTDAGELEMGELDRLARGLHLSNDAFWPAFSQQLEDIVKSHENGDLIMTLDFFRDMHHKFPMILYPALRLQVKDFCFLRGSRCTCPSSSPAVVQRTH